MLEDDPTKRLARVALILWRHGDPNVRVVGEALAAWWLSGASEPVDRVLGLRPAPGQRSARTQAAIARRDELFRQLATEHYAAEKRSTAALKIHRALLRYSASAWPRERAAAEVPRHRLGTPEAYFWLILKLQDRVVAARSIRSILAAS